MNNGSNQNECNENEKSVYLELNKEEEVDALISELNALKIKSAKRRSDEKRRNTVEIANLYEENYKLSVIIEALNRSLDKRHCQNVILTKENERHKNEKKRLYEYFLLKAQVTQSDYLSRNTSSEISSIVNRIKVLENENIELINKHQEVLNILETERHNCVKLMRFMFLKTIESKYSSRETSDILCKLESPEKAFSKVDFNTNEFLAKRKYSQKTDFNFESVRCHNSLSKELIISIPFYKEKLIKEFESKFDSKAHLQTPLQLKKSNKSLEINYGSLFLKPGCKKSIQLRKGNNENLSNCQIVRIVNSKNNRNNYTQERSFPKKFECAKIEKLKTALKNSIVILNKKRKNIQDVNYFEFYFLGVDNLWNNIYSAIKFDEIFTNKFYNALFFSKSVVTNNLTIVSDEINNNFQAIDNFAKIDEIVDFKNDEDTENSGNHSLHENSLIIEEVNENNFVEKDNFSSRNISEVSESALKMAQVTQNYHISKNTFSDNEPSTKAQSNTTVILRLEESDFNLGESVVKVAELNCDVNEETLQIKKRDSINTVNFETNGKTDNKKLDSIVNGENSKRIGNKFLSKIPIALPNICKRATDKKGLNAKKEIDRGSYINHRQKKITRSLSADQTPFSPTFQDLKKESAKKNKLKNRTIKVSKIPVRKTKILNPDFKIAKETIKLQNEIVLDSNCAEENLKSTLLHSEQSFKVDQGSGSRLQEQEEKYEKQDLKNVKSVTKQKLVLEKTKLEDVTQKEILENEDRTLKNEDQKLETTEGNLEIENLSVKNQKLEDKDENFSEKDESLKIEYVNLETDTETVKLKDESVRNEIQIKEIKNQNMESKDNNLKRNNDLKNEDQEKPENDFKHIKMKDVNVSMKNKSIEIMNKILLTEDANVENKVANMVNKVTNMENKVKSMENIVNEIKEKRVKFENQNMKTDFKNEENNERNMENNNLKNKVKNTETSFKNTEIENQNMKNENCSTNDNLKIVKQGIGKNNQEINLTLEKKNNESQDHVEFKRLDDSFDKTIGKEGTKEQLSETVLLKRTNGNTCVDRTPLCLTTQLLKSTIEKVEEKNSKTKFVFISKISQDYDLETKAENTENLFESEKSFGLFFNDESETSTIQLPVKDKILSSKVVKTKKKLKNPQTNGNSLKQVSKRNSSNSNQLFVVELEKLNTNKRRLPRKCEKRKIKLVDVSKSEKNEKKVKKKSRKKQNSRIKFGPELTAIDAGNGLFISRKAQNQGFPKKLSSNLTRSSSRVNISISSVESMFPKVINKRRRMILQKNVEGKVEESSSSKAILIQCEGNAETFQISSKKFAFDSKKTDIASWISQAASRSRQSGEKVEEQLSNNWISKESKKGVNKVWNCVGKSSRQSSRKGEEFIRGIHPSPESSKRVSDCEAVLEDFSFRKCTQISEDTAGDSSELTKRKEIKIKKMYRKWTNEIVKIEAWNIRVRNYLKEIRMELLEREKALEEESVRLLARNYSPGDRKELTFRNTAGDKYSRINISENSEKVDLETIFRDVKRVTNIINNHTAARYLNNRDCKF